MPRSLSAEQSKATPANNEESDANTVTTSTRLDGVLYDEIVTRAQVLRGQIIRLDEKGIEFKLVYGEGSLTIAYDDLENIVSQAPFHIVYDQDDVARGRLLGVEQGQLLVGADLSSARRVPLEKILIGVSQKDYDDSYLSQMRVDYRHWQASLNFGLSFEDGAVDKEKIDVGLNIERRKKPTRYVFDLNYIFETQERSDQPKVTSKDELASFFLGEWDISDRFYYFFQPAGEYDKPRRIESRFFPSTGIGYRFIESERETHFSLPLGIGFVREKFTGFNDNSYVSLYVGLEGRFKFVRDITLEGKILYMPGFENLRDNWLFRARFDLIVPVYDPIALRFRIADVLDNNPSRDVGNNKFVTTMALSLTF